MEENDIKELIPFHWDFIFGNIIEKGGFDIILTNPPWDKVKLEDKEFLMKYDDSVKKNKMSSNDLKRRRQELVQSKEKLSDYINENSSYKFQSNYFRIILQTSIWDNSKSRWNTKKIFC